MARYAVVREAAYSFRYFLTSLTPPAIMATFSDILTLIPLFVVIPTTIKVEPSFTSFFTCSFVWDWPFMFMVVLSFRVSSVFTMPVSYLEGVATLMVFMPSESWSGLPIV